MRIIGFTGTREGMTQAQKDVFASLVARMEPDEFHHGDCVGSDEEAHEMVCRSSARICIVIHPPDISVLRANCRAKDNPLSARLPLPYLERNRNIVRACEMLIATPKEQKEQHRGGTWSTIRLAGRLGKRIIVILPDGTVETSE